MKETAEKYLGQVSQAVITVPAYLMTLKDKLLMQVRLQALKFYELLMSQQQLPLLMV